jgi:zinc protease
METFFQLAHLHFTAPRWTDSAWSRLLSDYEVEMKARKNRPQGVFLDAVVEAVYGDSIRHVNASQRFYDLLDASKAEEAYRAFFSTPEHFVFIITGDVSLDAVKRLAAKYLASIPASAGASNRAAAPEAKDTSIPFPVGKPSVVVRKGLEEQAQVLLLFGGQNPTPIGEPHVEDALVRAMADLLDLRLREKVREKIGGTYSVGAYTSLVTYPVRRFVSQISFGCEPDKADSLIAAVLEEIAALQETTASEGDLGKLRENFLRTRESAYKDNGYWHSALTRNVGRGDLSGTIALESQVLGLLTGETLRRMIAQYFPLDNYLKGVLLPE